MSQEKSNCSKEANLAYGGQALIEGVLMRGQENYAFSVKTPQGKFYKEKNAYIALGKRNKVLGLPLLRGVVGFFENMYIGIKVMNKSLEVAFPEEKKKTESSSLSLYLSFILAIFIALIIFNGIPYVLTQFLNLDMDNNPFLYNLVSGIIRFCFFLIYLVFISFLKDTKRLFGYHGAEHKTIHAYENNQALTIKNVKKFSRLHPRCGTSFVFIVLLITIIVFPFFNIFFDSQLWYHAIRENLSPWLGKGIQLVIHIASHILIGMPIVAALSYELLRLSGRFNKLFPVKILIAPGLFFQLLTTCEPGDDMIKAAVLSLKMVLGQESEATARDVEQDCGLITAPANLPNLILWVPLFIFNAMDFQSIEI